jgi:hypothetical protein
MLAETDTGKIVRTYYVAVEKRWKQELLQKLAEKSAQKELPPPIELIQFNEAASESFSPLTFETRLVKSGQASEKIKSIVSQWLGHIFLRTRELVNEVSRESDHCFALIVKKAADEQIDLVNAISKGIDQIDLEVLARGAINRIIHRVPHQPGKISKVVEEQVHSHQEEFVQMLVSRLMELQVVHQPALPPAEEFPVRRTSAERRRAVIEFIFELIDQYGSLDAIPRRGKGKTGIDLEVEWGTNKLSKQFGVSRNTVRSIWSEVEEAIKKYGEIRARQYLW